MKDITNWRPRRKKCPSCPFRTDSAGRHPDPALVNKIQTQVLTHSSQICHHPRIHGEDEFELCRGARDFQLTLFYRLGHIEAPTDQAWEKASAHTDLPHA